MAKDKHIYGEVNNQADLKKVFSEIRGDVRKADSRPALTELYKRAGYLITLTKAPAWGKKFRGDIQGMRRTAKEEFSKTAHVVNSRAEKLGAKADYDDKWGK